MTAVAEKIKQLSEKSDARMSEKQLAFSKKYNEMLERGYINTPSYHLMGINQYMRAKV
jgi:hypothetical protein